MEFALGRVENIVERGENAGHFLLFPECFQKVTFFRVVKSRDCVVNKPDGNFANAFGLDQLKIGKISGNKSLLSCYSFNPSFGQTCRIGPRHHSVPTHAHSQEIKWKSFHCLYVNVNLVF